MIRSFLALELPEEHREEIRRLQSALKPAGGDVKWVRPEAVHLTLKFLGNVDPAVVKPLSETVGRAAAVLPAPDLSLQGAGVFPDDRRPRVIWLGLGGEVERLADVQRAVEDAAASFGFEPEKRAFRPHLTMGRVKSSRGRRGLLRALERLDPKPLAFRPTDVILFRSDLRPTGAVYTRLAALPLATDTD